MKNVDLADLTPEAQQLWSTWDIRAFVILSMIIQCFLVLSIFLRKRTSEATVTRLVLAFADWLTPYTIGLISYRQGSNGSCDSPAAVIDGDVLAFWAPFLLLHLGGPVKIKSQSVESDMWLQDLIRLISQTVSIIIIIIRSATPNAFYSAVMAVFIAGTLRYVARVQALYFARLKSSRESCVTEEKGPDNEKIYEAALAMKEANLPTLVKSVQLAPRKFNPYIQGLNFDTVEHRLGEKALLQFAFSFYYNFQGLFEGVSYGHEQRQVSRNFFLRRSSHDAFKLVEIELNIVQANLFFSEVGVKRGGIPYLRIIISALVVYASLMFYLHEKRGLSKIDKCISYALLFGALFIEIFSLIWTLLLSLNIIVFYNLVKHISFVTRKWSESFSKCRLIYYYLHHKTPPFIIRNIIEIFCLGAALESRKFKRTVTSGAVSEYLKKKIFRELCMRSELAQHAETATQICSQRGDWVIMQRYCYSQLKWSLQEIEYGHSLLLWHIATDLVCYNINDSGNDVLSLDQQSSNIASYRMYIEIQFCKDISQYLLYLLLEKPTMITQAVGDWVKPFSDTFQEAKRFFRKRSITDHEQACEAILSVKTDIEPILLKGDASASVLFDACRLAKQLLGFEEHYRWRLMSEVWMDLLTYAAFHSEATVHAHQPSQGGELLTFVWLLMNHLGLGKQFREEPARYGYRVTINK